MLSLDERDSQARHQRVVGVTRHLSGQNLAEQRHEGARRCFSLCHEVSDTALPIQRLQDHFLERGGRLVRRSLLATASLRDALGATSHFGSLLV